ncbi:MAG: KamA family radical SAM protein [Desulfobacteraceae bacterium]|jgi:lysine 2,3-aminomutase|nr:KamA family radical SAM protein [Desulfobacteraceae bacterium]
MTIYTANQQNIAKRISTKNVDLAHWRDWRWQLKHAIKKISMVESILGIQFEEDKRKKVKRTLDTFPLSITPYNLSLIAAEDYCNDPVFKQAFPSSQELEIEKFDIADLRCEDKDSPVPGIIHLDQDRVLFHVSNICSMSCRHCTRKPKASDTDTIPVSNDIPKGLEYIRNKPGVLDVELSGGDPLMLSDKYLGRILTELRQIEHVQVIRIGTRMPVVLPCRITPELVKVLKKNHPVWINTHFNHPREITTSSRRALRLLADAGISLGNQAVLLAGVNDSPGIIKSLVRTLVANRVRPYATQHPSNLSAGLSNFRTSIGKESRS